MYRLKHDSSEKKSYELIKDFLKISPKIRTQFEIVREADVLKADLVAREDNILLWVGEVKFGTDGKKSRNTKHYFNNLQYLHKRHPNVPRYVFLINPLKKKFWYDKKLKKYIPIIPFTREIIGNLMHEAVTKGNAIPYYVREDRFAELVWQKLKTPQKIVDTGVVYHEKSSGSEFNQSLQCYKGVTPLIADKIEERWPSMIDFVLSFAEVDVKSMYDDIIFNKEEASKELEDCFVSKTGRKMKSNKINFIKKITGEE